MTSWSRALVAFAVSTYVLGASAAAQPRARRGSPPAQAAESPPAPAADTAPDNQARDLFLRGQEAYRTGDYATAIRAWEEAVALDPRPALHYNIAQAHGRLGRLEEELAALRRFLDTAEASDGVLPSARARVAALEERLAQTSIVLTGSYEGARVILDGDDRGTMPLAEPLEVRPGSHAIDVELAGHQPFHAAVVVPAGERVQVAVVLREDEASVSASPMRAPIALYASGGAVLLTGAVFGTLALLGGSQSVEGTPDGDRARTFSIVADVTLGAGIALTGTAVVLHLLRRPDEPPDTAARVLPVLGPTGVGVGVGGSF